MRYTRSKTAISFAVLLAGMSQVGCAARAPLAAGEPVADPAALATELHNATVPESPRQATFAWMLDEAGSRVRGRGVVRYEAPERLRLDLFGPRGETYLTAALVGDQFRLPPGVTDVPLPSPSLLWAALGVVRPPADTPIAEAAAGDSLAALRYRLPSGEMLEFRTLRTAGSVRLTQVERSGRAGALETVRLEYSPDGELVRTRYRDWTAYRDLVLETEDVKDVPPFPESVWRPDGTAR